MNAYELADELQKMFVGEEYDRLVHEIPDLLRQQQAENEALKERVAFLEDQAIMVDPEDMKQSYVYKYLFGDDLLEAQKRINNMLRKMVDELPVKEKK